MIRKWKLVLTFTLFLAVFSGLSPGFTDMLHASRPSHRVLKSGDTLSRGMNATAPTTFIPSKQTGRHQSTPASVSGTSAVTPLDTFTKIRNAITPLRKQSALTTAQRANLRSLITAGSKDTGLRIHINPANGTPAYIKSGKKRARSLGGIVNLSNSRRAAEKFIADNRALFKLTDPASEMTVKKEWADRLGLRHVRFQQKYRGVPVWGREIMVHLDAANAIFLCQGRYEPTPEDLDVTPQITADDANTAVTNHLESKDGSPEMSEPELVIYTGTNRRPVLAYKIDVTADMDERWLYFIDAKNGSVLHRITKVHTELLTATAPDLGSVSRTFTAWADGGTQYLVDPTIPLDDPPYSPIPDIKNYGNTYTFDARNGDNDLWFITSDGTSWDPAGVSAAYNTRITHDYYKNTFGRNGIDDNNMNYLVVVHFKDMYANAFWNGEFIVFGDGDDTTFSNLAESLDITAHETQHGVTEHTAGLIYENQSGALNEAFSDIFACMVDRDDWTVGEDITLVSPGYLRSLADPSSGLSPLPSTMSEYQNLPNTETGDWGGVHINMSIPSRAAYLIAEGLTAEGLGTSIGREKTERIFYRALTTYLQASSQFLDAQIATVQAAEDLYGSDSTEVGAVQAAWDAVEVGGGGSPDDQSPTDTDRIEGADIMVYLYPRTDIADGIYDLYRQTIPNPFTGYDPSQDSSDLNYEWARAARPSAVTLSDGSLLFYVSAFYNLWGVYDDGTNEQITDSGDIWSFAISQDARYCSFTTIYADDNNIYVGDLDMGILTAYPAVSASDLPPGQDEAMNTILYADALSFDYKGRTLVFDALNSLSTQGIWSAMNFGLGYDYIYDMVIDPMTTSTLYVGTSNGVFKSIDGGAIWSPTGTINANPLYSDRISALAIDPMTPTIVYAGTEYDGVFKSINGGDTWTAVNNGLINNDIFDLAVDPLTPNIIYAATWGGGVFKSINGGASWSAMNNGLTSHDIRSLVINPVTTTTLYAGAGVSGTIFKSIDAGATWSEVYTDVTNIYFRALAVDPTTTGTMYAGRSGAGGGILKTTDGGTSWSAVNIGLTSRDVYSLAIDPMTPTTIYAGTRWGGVFKSTDMGNSWTAINTGLSNLIVRVLAIDQVTPNTLYVGTDGGGVFKFIPGSVYRYWSIGLLDINDGTFKFPYPNQSPDLDIAYPSFAYNNSYVIALDVLDYSSYDQDGTVSSMVKTMNWETKETKNVIDPDFTTDAQGAYGVPSFWGDDNYVTIQAKTGTGDYAYRVPIDETWAGNGSEAQKLNDYQVVMPVMHRVGVRTLTGAIQPNPTTLNFGTVTPGSSASLNVTLTNTGNRDVDITNIAITGSSAFSHNGTNALLPRNGSMTMTVTYKPVTSGTHAGTLIVTSDADVPQTSVSLTGSSGASPTIKPDLRCYEFVTHQPQVEGQNYYIDFTLCNISNCNANSSHAKLFLSTDRNFNILNDFDAGKATIKALLPNEHVTVRFNYTMPDLGTGDYNVYPIFMVDCDDEVDESDETNNIGVANEPFTARDASGDGGGNGGGSCFINAAACEFCFSQ